MPRTEDGGPAFPRPASIDTSSGTLPDGDRVIDPQAGMTLRDYFAGQALAGILAHDAAGVGTSAFSYSSRAVTAYRMADAMLRARSEN